MSRARDLMKAHLTNLTVVYLAADETLSEQHSDVGTVHIFLCGRAKDGSLVALHTIGAWT